MLYPTYLSSFSRLLEKDIRPISLYRVLRGKSSASKSVQPPSNPPPTSTKPTNSSSSSSFSTKPTKPSTSPIIIKDSQVRSAPKPSSPQLPSTDSFSTKNTLIKPVNQLIGGFGRYLFMLLLERSIQLISFPYVPSALSTSPLVPPIPHRSRNNRGSSAVVTNLSSRRSGRCLHFRVPLSL